MNATTKPLIVGFTALLLAPLNMLRAAEPTLPDQSPAPMAIGGQRVEHRASPVGLDVARPRFSWQLQGAANGLRQTAYQIQVALSADSLDKAGRPLLWDSGWVASDQSHLVAYAGKALRSSTPYFWRVRIKNQDAAVSAWSPVSRWVTGLLDAEKELRADWIGFDQPYPGTPHGDDWFAISQAQWICHPAMEKGQDAVAFYRMTFQAPADTTRVMIGMAGELVRPVFRQWR